MIFPPQILQKIQKAIDTHDEAYLLSMAKKGMPAPKKRPMHTALMVSAHNAKHLNKLDELRCDVAIINLEDGVAPEYKRSALLAAAIFLSRQKPHWPHLVVRINPLEAQGEEEIAFLNHFFPDAIRIPKIKKIQDVQRANTLINEAIAIHLSIETKEAFGTIAPLAISKRVQATYLGILDLLADLDLPHSLLELENPTITSILTHFLIQSKRGGMKPFSFVYQDYKNLEEFEAWCRFEKRLGFDAKACISPQQVDRANAIFTPSSKELEKAKYIKRRFEEMVSQGVTGFSDEKYGFIDEPIYKNACNILQRGGK